MLDKKLMRIEKHRIYWFNQLFFKSGDTILLSLGGRKIAKTKDKLNASKCGKTK